ncbi:anti-sigma-K factor rskA [Isoptericola jiangsuensis]|uniref:Regulator of SigK n=1 Tax=Isoptericola jiangsuensis TaxID=548579 RepID=A0A2A9F204_9MICO|nr:anti-sigma factor [Isoptericola jiangsuensis]PFG44485.1 anti-sigma-K factor rskA [Isoptericola jiangsuensis]
MADDARDAWELLPAYALDAVDDLDRRAVERLLAADPAARRALDEYRDVVAAFTVETEPPASVRDAVMARITGLPAAHAGLPAAIAPLPAPGTAQPSADDGRPAGSHARGAADVGTDDGGAGDAVVPIDRPRRRRWTFVAAAAAAVVAVAVPTTVAVQARQEQAVLQQRADAVARIMADPSAHLVRGEVAGGGKATVLMTSDDYLFSASGLPGPGDGQDYQLWVVGADGAVAPAGVLSTHDGAVEHLVQDVPGVGVAVTMEPEGGSEQPTSDPIVVLAEG